MNPLFKHILIAAAFGFCIAPYQSLADIIIRGPNDSWTVLNPRNEVATDLGVFSLDSDFNCSSSSGGSAFDRCSNFITGIIFAIGSGGNPGTGVAANSTLVINFANFDVGTDFSLFFSYGDRNGIDISEITDFAYNGQFDPMFPQGPQGRDALISVSEPPMAALLLTAFAAALRMRNYRIRAKWISLGQ